ncbi:MAG: efflux RND transporter periplasmic adaptor subunit [Patescibacteria group bacterium]
MAFFKKRTVQAVVALLVLGMVILAIVIENGGEKTPFLKVSRGSISEEVSITGKVASFNDISLAFEKSGRVVEVYRLVGERVLPGAPLVSLDSQDLFAQKLESEASVKAEEARLSEMQRGARPEELQIKETSVKQSEQELASAYAGALPILEDAYISADDAVRKQIDILIDRDEEVDPKLVFETGDSKAQIDAEAGRYASRNNLNTWRRELDALYGSSTSESLDAGLILAKAHLFTIANFLNRLSDAVQAAQRVPTDTIAIYKTNVNAARTKVSTSLTSVVNTIDEVSADRIALEQSQNNLALSRAGSSFEAVAAQSAKVEQARARVAQISAQLQKNTLYAPITGIVTKVDVRKGEIVAPNKNIVSLISDTKFQIEANVPEVDIAKVSVGDAVKITLDAFTREVFPGKVGIVEPAETIIDGAVNFKIKIFFENFDERVKSGFTANLDIQTDVKENALLLPQSAIIQNDNGVFVRKVVGQTTEDVSVTLGVRGSNGMVEIVSGVSDGEEVVNVGVKQET